MGFWAFREKVVPGPPSASGPALFEQVRGGRCRASFEAVGEALIAGRSATDACEVVGRLLGSQGVSLEETLADLRTTYELVLGTEPAFTDACAVALGWSEATLAYLHQLSCADPLTGLGQHGPSAGPAHGAVPGGHPRAGPPARPLRAGRRRGGRAAPHRARRRGLRPRPADVPDRRVRPLGLLRRRDRLPDRPAPDRGPGRPRRGAWPVVRRCCAACSRSASVASAASGSGARAFRWWPSRPRSLLDELSRDQAI